MSLNSKVFALIPCAGAGSRFGANGVKQYQLINGRPMIWHTLQAFRALGAQLAGLWVVVAATDTQFFSLLPDFKEPGQVLYPGGGATRALTVKNGLKAMLAAPEGAELNDWVLVHDAARCLIEPAQILALIQACQDDEVGGLLAQPLADTLKTETQGRVAATLDRTDKWLAQTPQMFRLGMLLAALEQAGDDVTDESSAMEARGLAPRLIAGSVQNIKVTYPQDMALARVVLQARLTQKDAA